DLVRVGVLLQQFAEEQLGPPHVQHGVVAEALALVLHRLLEQLVRLLDVHARFEGRGECVEHVQVVGWLEHQVETHQLLLGPLDPLLVPALQVVRPQLAQALLVLAAGGVGPLDDVEVRGRAGGRGQFAAALLVLFRLPLVRGLGSCPPDEGHPGPEHDQQHGPSHADPSVYGHGKRTDPRARRGSGQGGWAGRGHGFPVSGPPPGGSPGPWPESPGVPGVLPDGPGYGVCVPLGPWSGRPKIIPPAGVSSTPVTPIAASCRMSGRPCSPPTLVPSSRSPTPWPIWSPALTSRTKRYSPGRATVLRALASSLRLMTSTPWSWAILFRLKSLVTTRAPRALAK